MRSNSRIVGAVLVGLGAWFLGCYVQSNKKQQKKLAAKTFAKEAVQSWEGEGGTIIDPLPRSATS